MRDAPKQGKTLMFYDTIFKTRTLYTAACIASVLALSLLSSPAQAWHDDDRDYDPPAFHTDHGDYNGPRCVTVVKKIRLARGFTYSEKGKACRDRGGNWTMLTPSRYPENLAEVFFRRHGKLVFAGIIKPEETYEHPWHDTDHNWSKEPDFGYAEHGKCLKNNNYRKHHHKYDD
jgi:hypothetical protein